MPIYEYRSVKKGCNHCSKGFDVIQNIKDSPISACPQCGAAVRRAISRFSACVIDGAPETASVENKLREYESEGKWSHAAELADKSGLNDRAMDDYKKAGYNF